MFCVVQKIVPNLGCASRFNGNLGRAERWPRGICFGTAHHAAKRYGCVGIGRSGGSHVCRSYGSHASSHSVLWGLRVAPPRPALLPAPFAAEVTRLAIRRRGRSPSPVGRCPVTDAVEVISAWREERPHLSACGFEYGRVGGEGGERGAVVDGVSSSGRRRRRRCDGGPWPGAASSFLPPTSCGPARAKDPWGSGLWCFHPTRGVAGSMSVNVQMGSGGGTGGGAAGYVMCSEATSGWIRRGRCQSKEAPKGQANNKPRQGSLRATFEEASVL
ncbi:uncharacterized protein [Triticum aestivum]|uniref:uncharacterized protein n=1 Tax=Triticum aestivum TaxID=4565 RepID=UPI001D00939E|nr:uncharacterized protein LOC123142354 [Triticum aestivum]